MEQIWRCDAVSDRLFLGYALHLQILKIHSVAERQTVYSRAVIYEWRVIQPQSAVVASPLTDWSLCPTGERFVCRPSFTDTANCFNDHEVLFGGASVQRDPGSGERSGRR